MSDLNLYNIQAAIIEELSRTQSCIIVGKCADHILRDKSNVLSVFVDAYYTARTVPIALNYYLGTFANNYSALFAAVIITVLPTIIIFIILQKQVMESMTAGAVKG